MFTQKIFPTSPIIYNEFTSKKCEFIKYVSESNMSHYYTMIIRIGTFDSIDL